MSNNNNEVKRTFVQITPPAQKPLRNTTPLVQGPQGGAMRWASNAGRGI